MFFDAHAHLDDEAFDQDRDQVLQNIKKTQIHVINAGSNIPSSRMAVDLAQNHDFIYACVGIHPHDAKDAPENYLHELEEMAQDPKVVAIGEIGLDYYYEFSDKPAQKKVFLEQLELAKSLDLPVVVHDREAHQDTLDIIKKSGIKKGLMHCYSGSLELAQEFMKLGFYFSFGGVITFKNAKRPKQTASKIPLDKILLETDCPYLSPEPYRGKRNDPTRIPIIAQTLADLRGIPLEEVQQITTQNIRELFEKVDRNGKL